jgi:uncharacterized membrane protein YcaP (DUF421 family)
VLRLMGKRQIGELQPSELVTTLLLSQIASQPILAQNVPIAYGVIPVCVVVCLEVILSFVMTRVPFLKRLFVGKPSILINKGKMDTKELMRVRVTVEELMSELRSHGVGDPADVYYAVMEENGSISVLLKAASETVRRKDIDIKADESGISRLIISDGVVNTENLKKAGKDEKWLKKQLDQSKLCAKDVFMMTCSDTSGVYTVKKQKKGGGK